MHLHMYYINHLGFGFPNLKTLLRSPIYIISIWLKAIYIIKVIISLLMYNTSLRSYTYTFKVIHYSVNNHNCFDNITIFNQIPFDVILEGIIISYLKSRVWLVIVF